MRGNVKRTTVADPVAPRPAGLELRRFNAPAPNRLSVADITYVSTWSGWVYVAFVIDAYARRIVDWRAATSMSTTLVLDADRAPAIWTRNHGGHFSMENVVHHTETERLAVEGIQPSVGAVGSSDDNALAETINGLYKTELIRRRGPRRGLDQVELATAEWVDWFNHRRLYEGCGDIPPVELVNAYYAHHQAQPPAELSHQ